MATKTKVHCVALSGFVEGAADARDCGLKIGLGSTDHILSAAKSSPALARTRARWLADRCLRVYVPSLLRRHALTDEAKSLENLLPLTGQASAKAALRIATFYERSIVEPSCSTALHWAIKACKNSVKKYAYTKGSKQNLAPYAAAAACAAFVVAVTGANGDVILLGAASLKAAREKA
jgi:hypothetical protein